MNPSLWSKINWKGAGAMVFALTLLPWAGTAWSQKSPRTADVRNTPHNLSTSGKGPWTASGAFGTFSGTTMIRANTETEVCVFCHTPHGAASPASGKPLWNRSMGSSTYSKYTSESIQAAELTGAGYAVSNGSKLCLSCHDGTVAIGSVTNAPGSGYGSGIATSTGGNAGCMPLGAGVDAGRTRNLGGNATGCGNTSLTIDLSNDHPISFTYDSNLVTADGELRSVGGVIANPTTGVKPKAPLNNSMVECATCHDPHIKPTPTPGDVANGDHNTKFLRLNRFQVRTNPGATFDETEDISCLACHNKDGWVGSAHADSSVAAETYKTTGTFLADRDFPSTIAVWQAACLNCHDTHTAKGARRLARAGTTGGLAGGSSAIEETCYQCHRLSSEAAITIGTTPSGKLEVPNIRSDFTTTGNKRMPIAIATEKHAIKDKDFTEDPATLGKGVAANRHVECTDCHNPHRVVRNSLFNKQGAADERTHKVGSNATNNGADGNVASGVLRGAWGVEPVFGTIGNTWPQRPSSYTVKQGVPTSTSTAKTETYLTREYQLCFKCHSDYGTGTSVSTDPPSSGFPSLGYTGGTPSATNGMSSYTNVAAEFGSVSAGATPTTGTDQAEYGDCGSNCVEDGTSHNPAGSYPADALSTNVPGSMDDDAAGVHNHRSWHPVMYPTGRTYDERRISDTTTPNFRTPFKTYLGTQTMHCSDCHGNSGSWTQDTGPNTNTQGPHGSPQNFILKGEWSTNANIGSPLFCGNCHNPTLGSINSAGDNPSGAPSGFNRTVGTTTGRYSGHGDPHSGKPCMRCHVAVPHGWRNKAFLVNLNCVGKEGGQTTDCYTVNGAGYGGNSNTVTLAPYYNASFLRVATWRASGNWTESSCGVRAGGDKAAGKDWMTDGGQC